MNPDTINDLGKAASLHIGASTSHLRVLLTAMALAAFVAMPTTTQAQGFVPSTIQTGIDGPRSLMAADINQDGFQDVAVVAINADKVLWYEHDGSSVSPSFTEHDLTASDPADGPRDVHVADVDADGDLDILVVALTPDNVSSNENGELIWYENDGAASFSASVLDNTLLRPRSVSTADIDGDGALDIVVASASDSDIFYYRSDGATNPSFVRRSVTGSVPGVSLARAADLDGDGDTDVAAAITEGRDEGVKIEGNRVVWLENVGDTNGNGKPNFEEITIQSGATGVLVIEIADINGDGALDLVSAIAGDNTIGWHENDGAADPSFTNRVISSSANDVRSVSVADAEGDGDIDIFGSAFGDDAIYAFANSGTSSPTFTQEIVSSAVGGSTGAAITTIDSDDRLDVFAIAGEDNEVLWFKNESSVLPVELVSFEAVVNENTATLRWETLSETNNDGFAIEKRSGDRFREIGYVSGQGTTLERQAYQYQTAALDPGAHTFRLRQVDLDGSSSYSEEVEVQMALGSAYMLSNAYPNPLRKRARMELRVQTSQHVRVEVFDYLGRRVTVLHDDVVPANHVHQITLSGQGLRSGAYFVRAVGEDFQVTRSITVVK
jgi:hypothetical protein